MYRQIRVHGEDQAMQNFFWRSESQEPIKIYQLSTVTYGTASAPFLATRCLKQLALEGTDKYPDAARVILTDFFVDDLLSGSNTIASTINLRDQLINLLGTAGFQLAKWASNVPEVLQGMPNLQRDTVISLDDNQEFKTLGVLWKPQNDTLEFSTRFITPKRITKRTILSIISQIFDPLGVIGPVSVKAKILLQKLWELKIDWDESVPSDIYTNWQQFYKKLQSLNYLKIPRHVLCFEPKFIEIHAFSDASESAYGASIYLRSTDRSNNHHVRLLCAKSRVAPLKRISIPRLELCAAVLSANLVNRIFEALQITANKKYYWCDSTIVLAWIATPPNQLKTFVGNRIAEIQTLSDASQWKHIISNENPADLISRGVHADELLECQLWWRGPSWLVQDVETWPIPTNAYSPNSEEVPERRRNCVTLIATEVQNIFNSFSTLLKLKRVVAYCFRFRQNSSKPHEMRNFGPLTVKELNTSLLNLIKIAQEQEFSADINSLKKKKGVNPKSRLLTINPFLDTDGLIRVGGRINKANIPYNQRHQIVLPQGHPLTKLIINNEHKNLLHAGAQSVLASLRLRYWPLSGSRTVRGTIRNCLRCTRCEPKTIQPLMGNLPKERVLPTRPFLTCGVDYAGPFTIKESTARRAKLRKAYLSIFICFSTKAVHLEVVSDLTTEAFLAALKRFIGRRGKCSKIFSDNATNFVGSRNELKELANLLIFNETQERIQTFLANQEIEWHFIPPNSPNFGGLWESAVKLAKKHLTRVAGGASLTFEELATLFIQIEACLNSRPITPSSSDPNDLSPLTPGHFLIQDSLLAPPEMDIRKLKLNTLSRWQRVQQLFQHFWARWSQEYLTTLQHRRKWHNSSKHDIQKGQLVIIKDDNNPPLHWKLGRIKELHPGSDGVVRVITLKTSKGEIKRAVARVCPLRINENETE